MWGGGTKSPFINFIMYISQSNTLDSSNCAHIWQVLLQHYHNQAAVTQIDDKSDIKCKNTLGCLDQYVCSGLRLWNSRDHETV